MEDLEELENCVTGRKTQKKKKLQLRKYKLPNFLNI